MRIWAIQWEKKNGVLVTCIIVLCIVVKLYVPKAVSTMGNLIENGHTDYTVCL